MDAEVLVIACGALAREIVFLVRRNEWRHVTVMCLPAALHNAPEKIPAAVVRMIEARRREYAHMFVAYADCGTGGLLDKALLPYGIERLPGAHCYETFTGTARFTGLCEAEPGTFYLTDFLVRHFERLVLRGLGLHRHPQLRNQYFGHYRRALYLAQSRSPQLSQLARQHAAWLQLEYEEHFTGLARLGHVLGEHVVQWRSRSPTKANAVAAGGLVRTP